MVRLTEAACWSRTGSRLDRHSQLDPIIWRVYEILSRTQIPLGGLDGLMTEQQLDLLQFAACRPTQLGARTTEVMRRDARQANRDSVLLEELPNDLLTHGGALDLIAALYPAANRPFCKGSR